MSISLDRDALRYLGLRREQSAMSSGLRLEPETLRNEERALRSRYGSGPRMWRETLVQSADETPRHFVLEPTEHPNGVLVYIHGGGWVIGEPEDYLAVCRALARTSGWRVIVTDYRKAPENPFPAGLHDCLAMVRDEQERIRRRAPLGEHPFPLVVGGDSAGGNLAAAIAAEYAVEAPKALAAQLLITPVLDSNLDAPSYLDPERQLSLTRDTMAWFWEQYASPSQRLSPRAAPLRAASVSELPPTIFISVESDVLHSEERRYLERLISAGVPVRHREYSGQLHGFFQLYNVMSAVEDAVAWISDELREVARAGNRRTFQEGAVQ